MEAKEGTAAGRKEETGCRQSLSHGWETSMVSCVRKAKGLPDQAEEKGTGGEPEGKDPGGELKAVYRTFRSGCQGHEEDPLGSEGKESSRMVV